MMDEPRTMRAVVATGGGGPEVLDLVERPVPTPGEGEVLVRVAAAGVNRPDVLQRQGLYPPPPGAPDVLGLEIAGAVAALGPGASRFREGDQVLRARSGRRLRRLRRGSRRPTPCPSPPDFRPRRPAAIPETYFTVWTNVFERGRLRPGETLLVHGGTSGIGTTAIQLAKAFGASVVATAGSDAKCDACLRLGADVAVNYRDARLRRSGQGGDRRARGRRHPRHGRRRLHPPQPRGGGEDGRIVQIAFLKASKVELDFRRLMLKRLTHTGSTLRARSVAEKAAIARALEERVWPLLAEGRCRPVMDSTYPARRGPARPTPAWTAASISARSC